MKIGVEYIFYKNTTPAKKTAFRCAAICFLVVLINLFPFMGHGADKRSKENHAHCIVELQGGIMDWTTGVVHAQGRSDGLKMAWKGAFETVSDKSSELLLDSSSKLLQKKAIFNARKHLVKIFRSIAAGQDRRIAYNGYSLHILKAEMERKALNAEHTASRLLADGIVSVVLKTDIYGAFLQQILPSELRQIPDIEVVEPENQYEKGEKYTGMVIDARDIGFKPILYPVIVSEQGKEIYGALFASREYAVEKGLCSYAYLPEPELMVRRAGENPVVIKGLRKEGDNNDTIVITISDADKISRMPERHQFMRACKVLILVRKPF